MASPQCSSSLPVLLQHLGMLESLIREFRETREKTFSSRANVGRRQQRRTGTNGTDSDFSRSYIRK